MIDRPKFSESQSDDTRDREDEAMRDDEVQAEQNEGVRKHLGKAAPARRRAKDVRTTSATTHGGDQGLRADEKNPGSHYRGS
jgi:hypothetical protein